MKKNYVLAYAIAFIMSVVLNTSTVFAYDNTVTNYYVKFTSGFYKDTVQFDYPNKNVFCYKETKSINFYFYNDDTGESELINSALISNGKLTIYHTYYGTTNEQAFANNSITTTTNNATINDTNMQVFTDLEEANTYFASMYAPEPSTEEPTVEPSTEEPTVEPSTEEPTVEPSTEEPTVEPSTEEPTVEPSTEEPTVEPSYDLSEEEENLYNSTVNYLNTFLQVCFLNGFILGTLLSFIGYGVFKAFSLLNIHNRT